MRTTMPVQVRYDGFDLTQGPTPTALPLGSDPDSGERLWSAPGHLLLSGSTGAGTSAAIRAWITAARERGELVDVIDFGVRSYGRLAELPGLRVHTNVHAALRAVVELQASATAALSQAEAGPPRRLVVGDVAALVMADKWLVGTGQVRGVSRPLTQALIWLLLQGRQADHHVILGTSHGLPAYWSGLGAQDVRNLVPTVVRLGPASALVWRSLFGTADWQEVPRTPGRGVTAGNLELPRALQAPWLAFPEMYDRLTAAPPVPAWFTAGELPPWMTDEVWQQAAAVLEGGGR